MVSTCIAAIAQAPHSEIGKTATSEEIKAWDITISNDGKGLPVGHGTSAEGAKIYAAKCAMCHGANGRATIAPNVIIDKDPNTKNPRARRVFVTRVPFAPVLWDYINRAMPMKLGPGTLKPDEVYAVTAFLLSENEIIPADAVMDEQSLPKVKMPNHDGYVAPASAAWTPQVRSSAAAKRKNVSEKK